VAISDNWAAAVAPSIEVVPASLYGAAYLYKFDGDSWIRTDTIYSSPGSEIGLSVDIHEAQMLLGSYKLPIDGMTNVGGAFLYERVNDSWELLDTLVVPGSSANSQSGEVVALGKNIAVFNRRLEPMVYVFAREDDSSWVFVDSLTVEGVSSQFGEALTVTGNRLAAGGGGAVAICSIADFAAPVLSIDTVLQAPTGANGNFGEDLFMLDDDLIVTAEYNVLDKVYVYQRTDMTWSLKADLNSKTSFDGVRGVLTPVAVVLGVPAVGAWGGYLVYPRTD
jgi:hypothetical protein